MFRTPPRDEIQVNASGQEMLRNPDTFADKLNSCGQCNQDDSNDLVQCDKCDIWYHFTCVGVTASVENRDWICNKCRKEMENRNVALSKAPSINSGASSRKRLLELELQRLDEEKALEARHIQKKFEILAMSEKAEGSIRSEAASRTKEWVSNLQNFPQSQLDEARQGKQQIYNEGLEARPNLPDERLPSLTQSQLLARRVVSVELPVFTGRSEDWPLFISSYDESTKLCGYTYSENLLRLQKCLKGKAFDAVSCHLLLPKNVPEVIRTLKMMFGRPEIIINTLLDKIRSEPPPKIDKLDTVINYAILVRNLCSTLEASGLEEHMSNPLLLQELVDKLPAQIKLQWAMHTGLRNASIAEFSKWLFSIAEAVSKVCLPIISSKVSGNVHEHEMEQRSETRSVCLICGKNHLVDACETFLDMKLSDRWDKVHLLKLCRLCLQKHGYYRCSDKKCPIEGCEARHHNLLHKFKTNHTVTTHTIRDASNKTFFKILPVTLYNKGVYIETFAFLDDGSNVTLIEKEICNKLRLEGNLNNLCLKWTSGTRRIEEDSMEVSLCISGRGENSKRYELSNVQSIKNLSLPEQRVTREDLEVYRHLKKLPIATYDKVSPKILIGLNNGYVCNSLKIVEGTMNEPFASKTRLGWVIHGGKAASSEKVVSVHNIQKCNCEYEMDKLQKILAEHMSLEDAGCKYVLTSPEEKRANLLLQTTSRRIGERFETGLLWREDNISLPNSLPMALKRLHCLEKKTDPKHIPIITQQIEALVEKGYARKLRKDEVDESKGLVWYLPIFTVINQNKPGKIRLVWDAAAKVKGVSLNSVLMKGPDMMTPLLTVLHGFRFKKIAICGDIKEMFHQILIRKEDQGAQRFIWRNGENGRDPDIFVMKVMTFGAACSPSSAQYIKNRNALEFKDKFPRAVDAIVNHHYVDDLLDCADSEDAAVELAKQVGFIHSQGGFFIRNWKSNSKYVLENLDELEEQKKVPFCENVLQISKEKVLGMWWSTTDDYFTYSLELNRVNKDVLSGLKRPTKTDILRTLMSIFDPFGFLSTFVVYLKILLQEVWRTTIGWSDEVNEEVFQKWLIWVKILPKIESVKIPRWHKIVSKSSVQLHIFVDASELAYAAVAYFRVSTEDKIDISLACAKAKVAPKKPLSIPRMELMAAVLGVRLAHSICTSSKIQIEKRNFWSDSNTVLCWLKADPRNYKQFVMYRIAEILESSEVSEWRYICTKDNVADAATKWKKPFEFNMSDQWFSGPTFLSRNEEEWPSTKPQNQKVAEEMRNRHIFVHSEVLNTEFIDFQKFSSWKKLRQMVVYLFTFHYKIKMKMYKRKCKFYKFPETSRLLEMAENLIYRKIQFESYKDEYFSLLNKAGHISRSSDLFKCSPYIDEKLVIRMHGRISMAPGIPDHVKHPIILPRNHPCTRLLIKYFHEKFHHTHHNTCLNEMRQYYYILRLRVELKKVRRNCQVCKNLNAMPVVPEMAILPKARLMAFTRPFTYIGIDYFGPLYVKVARHQEKRWGVIFTCLTIRAIHIEVAHSMTTDSCIMVIQNFVSRRGTPNEIYCDNGTNFRGAETELKNALKNVDFSKISLKFSSSSTTWRFNPPAAPHMGGCWERLVQSVKKVLRQIIPNFTFKDETLYNGLLECEHVINSRPLTYVNLELSSDEALTPNHFLLGSSSGSKPIGVFSEDDILLRKNWRKMQYFADLFWKRWIQEYLPTITRRTKWFKKCSPLEVGDIVIIVDPNLPRNIWPKGIIKSVCVSSDGNVRSATVQTTGGITLNRPVAKLAKLDVRKPLESEKRVK